MSRIRLVLSVLLLGLTIACNFGRGTPPPALPWQETVDAVANLTKGTGVPQHLQNQDAVKTPGDFDVNTYFSVLQHLSMEPGYVLDYVYLFDGMGGRPVLYARPEEQSPYATYSEYRAAMGDGALTNAYLAQIHVDDTPEGFFELVTLDIMASQFYLYWHSAYNDWRIVGNRDVAEAIVDSTDGLGVPITNGARRAALRLDFAPKVSMDDDTVEVRVVTFTKWGGFHEERYTIQRSFPHTIVDNNREVLVAYDCGIMF